MSAIYRTQLFNPADIDNVKKIQAEYKAEPLSSFEGTAAPPAAPEIDFPTYNAAEAGGIDFINYLNFLLRFCPAVPSEKGLMEQFAKIGIGPGELFDPSQYPPDIADAINKGISDAREAMAETAASTSSSEDAFGTRAMLGDNYLLRALQRSWEYTAIRRRRPSTSFTRRTARETRWMRPRTITRSRSRRTGCLPPRLFGP